jgi:hypothetical protein
MAGRCTVCKHPERVGIDRLIATGTASLREIADRYGLGPSAVSRHVARHLQVQGMATPAAVAKQVVQAVRQEQQREQRQVQSVWVGRLHKTYADAASAYNRAMGEEDGIDAAAKFLMVQARLCDTGLRADGVLAGGAEGRVTVNVEQLVVLPQPTAVRPEPKTIDVDSKGLTS